MHSTSRTKIVAHSAYMKWRGTLSTSVAFLLAALRPTCLRHLGVKKQSQACETGRVGSRLACPCVMLVESDVYRHSCGIVP
jgi:hypothetical protein